VESNRALSVCPLYTSSRGKGRQLLQLAMKAGMGKGTKHRTSLAIRDVDVLMKDLITIPRQPIPSRLGFRFSRKAYPILLW
jgi:hypothetical protein